MTKIKPLSMLLCLTIAVSSPVQVMASESEPILGSIYLTSEVSEESSEDPSQIDSEKYIDENIETSDPIDALSSEEDADSEDKEITESDAALGEDLMTADDTKLQSSLFGDTPNEDYEYITVTEDGRTLIKCKTISGAIYEGDANERFDDVYYEDKKSFGINNINFNGFLNPIDAIRIRQQAKRIVNEYITDDMSDLEKYWTLLYKTGLFSSNADYPEEYTKVMFYYGYNGVARNNYECTAIGPLGLNIPTPLSWLGFYLTYSELCYAAGLPFYYYIDESYGTCGYLPNINGMDYLLYMNPEEPPQFVCSHNGSAPCLDKVTLSSNAFRSQYQVMTWSKYETTAAMTFDEWLSYEKECSDYKEYGSGVRGARLAYISDCMKERIETEYDFIHNGKFYGSTPLEGYITKELSPTIINVGETATHTELSSSEIAHFLFEGKEKYYEEWGFWDEGYTCTIHDFYAREDHNCVKEGCFSIDPSTGTITIPQKLKTSQHYLKYDNDNDSYYILIPARIKVGQLSYLKDLDLNFVGQITDDDCNIHVGMVECELRIPYTPDNVINDSYHPILYPDRQIVPYTPSSDGPHYPYDPDPQEDIAPAFQSNIIQLYEGETLTANEVVQGNINYEVTFSTTRSDVFTISNETGEKGAITALQPGSGTAYMLLNGEEIDRARVDVLQPYISGDDIIILSHTVATSYTIESEKTGDAYPMNFVSSDPSVLEITDVGKWKVYVRPKKTGEVTLTATDRHGNILTKKVIVSEAPGYKVSSINMNVGINVPIDEVFYSPFDTRYESSNNNIVKIENDNIIPVKSGTATLTAYTYATSYKLKINVYNPVLSGVQDIYLDGKAVTFKVTGGLGTTEWESSDPNILTVTNNGVVKGVSGGTATITATNNNKVMSIPVSVHRIPRLISNTVRINLDKTLVFGENVFDSVDINPANISYKSSNTKIAVMDGDTLKPLKTGTVNVTIQAGTKKFTAKVIIYDPKLTAPNIVYLNNKNVTLKIKSGDKTTKWSTSNPDVLSITSKGVVRGISNGHVTITAVNNNRTITKDIYVCKVPTFNMKSVVINDGDTLDLDNEYFDDSGIGNVTYLVSNPKVIELGENNIAKGLKKGSSKITAVCDNKKYTMTVNVFAPAISGTDILLLNNKTASLKVKNGKGTTQWSSSDSETVSVTNKGVIKGLKKGNAVITAVNNGRTMELPVSVYNIPRFEKQYNTVVGANIEVKLIKDADMPEPVYSVSNKKCATINENGILTPLKKGTVTVTAAIGGKKYTTKVIIK